MKIKLMLLAMMVVLSFSYASAQGFKNLSAEEVKGLIDKKTNMVIADVRTEQEYTEGHVPTSINIPPDKYSAISSFLPKNKNTLIIFYCRGYG